MIPTVLLITEIPSVRYAMKKHLEKDYFLVETADRNEAVAILSSTPLDLIILDSRLQFDALELAESMRKKEPITPILLITGRLKKSFRDEALEAGVSDFLQEQLDFDELDTRIAILQKAKKAREKTKGLTSLIKTEQPKSSKMRRKITKGRPNS